MVRNKYKDLLCALERYASVPRIHCNTGLKFDSIYSMLRKLSEMGLVEARKNEERSGFRYILTPYGREVVERLKEEI